MYSPAFLFVNIIIMTILSLETIDSSSAREREREKGKEGKFIYETIRHQAHRQSKSTHTPKEESE